MPLDRSRATPALPRPRRRGGGGCGHVEVQVASEPLTAGIEFSLACSVCLLRFCVHGYSKKRVHSRAFGRTVVVQALSLLLLTSACKRAFCYKALPSPPARCCLCHAIEHTAAIVVAIVVSLKARGACISFYGARDRETGNRVGWSPRALSKITMNNTRM